MPVCLSYFPTLNYYTEAFRDYLPLAVSGYSSSSSVKEQWENCVCTPLYHAVSQESIQSHRKGATGLINSPIMTLHRTSLTGLKLQWRATLLPKSVI